MLSIAVILTLSSRIAFTTCIGIDSMLQSARTLESWFPSLPQKVRVDGRVLLASVPSCEAKRCAASAHETGYGTLAMLCA